MNEQRGRGRVLGLDVGDRRIGVAVSDPDRRFAVPLRSIDRARGGELAAIRAFVLEDEVEAIVVGLPLSLSGESGPQAASVTAFARELEHGLDLPVRLWDERLSTREAESLVAGDRRGRGRRRGERSRAAVADTDALAASIILQGLPRPSARTR